MSDSTTLAAGSAFGRYTIQRVLGAGAFGAVYEATQLPLGKRVALKILHVSQMHNMEAIERFTAEAEATAKLRHPHIVDVLDLGAHEGVPFIAMEYLEGEALGARLHREGRLSTRSAVDLLLPVFSAVATVHDAAIVHRDLKPDNIFLSVPRPGKVHAKVLDFGIAKVSEARHSLTRTGAMMGTVFYMSPEQARESKDVDGRSDQWALGVIVYECITGRCPFPGEAMIDVLTGIISAPLPPMSDVEALPAGVEQVLRRATSKDRGGRYPSVRAMAAELLPYASPAVREEWAAEFATSAGAGDEDFQTATTLNTESAVPNAPVGSVAATLVQSVSVAGQEVSVARRAAEGAAQDAGAGSGRRGMILAAAGAATLAVVVAVGLALGDSSRATRSTPGVTAGGDAVCGHRGGSASVRADRDRWANARNGAGRAELPAGRAAASDAGERARVRRDGGGFRCRPATAGAGGVGGGSGSGGASGGGASGGGADRGPGRRRASGGRDQAPTGRGGAATAGDAHGGARDVGR
jgi:serine/threonine-protein kinase